MKRKQVMNRETLASQLEEWAARIRTGEPLRVGEISARLPARVGVETEIESSDGRTELELEVTWPASPLATGPLVGILTGSPNDLEIVRGARDTLESLDVPCEVRVLSAHRTPDLTIEYVRSAEHGGVEVFIACAGMANHLAGTVAAHTALPVIGVPLASGRLGGFDSLLSTVQMPPGVPVATVAVDGARNAGFLAARILALKYPEIRTRLDAAMAKERTRYDKARLDAEEHLNSASVVAAPKVRSAGKAGKPQRAGR